MPHLNAHAALARRTQAVLDILLRSCDANPDWVATVAFYKAVHIVEAVFKHEDGSDSIGHGDRNLRIRQDHPDIWRLYAPLWMASKVARYLECGEHGTPSHQSFSTFAQHRSPNQVRNLVSHNLRKIEAWAEGVIGGGLKFTEPPPPATPSAPAS
jgi:hypothetical protein